MRAPVRLPNTVWRLVEGAHPSHVLVPSRSFQDLFIWNRFEIGATLIVPELLNPMAELPLSTVARQGLNVFGELYPEWLARKPYMSIPLQERECRLERIYGDLSLVLVPQIGELPRDLYKQLLHEQLHGRPPVARGENVDLWVIKVPHPDKLPLAIFKALLLEYADAWHTTLTEAQRTPSIKLSGKGSLSAQLRYQLEMLGRYRLFRSNDFDTCRTLVAAYGKDNRDARDLFHNARRFIDRLYPRRWTEAEQAFCPLAYGVQ